MLVTTCTHMYMITWLYLVLALRYYEIRLLFDETPDISSDVADTVVAGDFIVNIPGIKYAKKQRFFL